MANAANIANAAAAIARHVREQTELYPRVTHMHFVREALGVRVTWTREGDVVTYETREHRQGEYWGPTRSEVVLANRRLWEARPVLSRDTLTLAGPVAA